jgi:hypothetical protein
MENRSNLTAVVTAEAEADTNRFARQWVVFGVVAGLLGDAAYFAASILGAISPGPELIHLILGAAFGPLLSLGFIGLYYFIRQHRNTPVLQAATLFGITAGVLVNVMIVVQMALALGFDAGLKESLGSPPSHFRRPVPGRLIGDRWRVPGTLS